LRFLYLGMEVRGRFLPLPLAETKGRTPPSISLPGGKGEVPFPFFPRREGKESFISPLLSPLPPPPDSGKKSGSSPPLDFVFFLPLSARGRKHPAGPLLFFRPLSDATHQVSCWFVSPHSMVRYIDFPTPPFVFFSLFFPTRTFKKVDEHFPGSRSHLRRGTGEYFGLSPFFSSLAARAIQKDDILFFFLATPSSGEDRGVLPFFFLKESGNSSSPDPFPLHANWAQDPLPFFLQVVVLFFP